MKHVVCTITQTKAILIRTEFVWKNEFCFSYDGFSKTLNSDSNAFIGDNFFHSQPGFVQKKVSHLLILVHQEKHQLK